MDFHPDITPRLVDSPLGGALTTVICQSDAPRRRDGRQSDINVAVRKGKRHPALALDRILVEEREAGASEAWALNVVRAIRQSVLQMWGILPDTSCPVDAHLAETDAECAANPLQARVFSNIAGAADHELDRLAVALDLQIARAEGLVLALEAEKARRADARATARRRLSA